MAATRAKRKSNHENTPESEGLLASLARTVGHAAGAAAKAVGLDHADAGRTKTPKRLSARVRRTNHAEEVKSAAKSLFPKGSAALGAPYRRVMGKPTANWTEKISNISTGWSRNTASSRRPRRLLGIWRLCRAWLAKGLPTYVGQTLSSVNPASSAIVPQIG